MVWFHSTSRFGTEALKYFVPFNKRKTTINAVYCVETGGHLDNLFQFTIFYRFLYINYSQKTLDKFKDRFFWPDLAKDVKIFFKECYHCQSVKAPKSYPVPPLIPITPSGTRQWVTMDIGGPLETNDKNKYILAICDHFTKYTVLFAMADQTAETVASKIVEFAMTFGLPESILSDQGTNFRLSCWNHCGKPWIFTNFDHRHLIRRLMG